MTAHREFHVVSLMPTPSGCCGRPLWVESSLRRIQRYRKLPEALAFEGRDEAEIAGGATRTFFANWFPQ